MQPMSESKVDQSRKGGAIENNQRKSIRLRPASPLLEDVADRNTGLAVLGMPQGQREGVGIGARTYAPTGCFLAVLSQRLRRSHLARVSRRLATTTASVA